MTKIGLLGDVHGNAHTTLAALRKFFVNDIESIIQVGDFGFSTGKHGSAFLTYVNTLLSKNGQTMYVTPGNHEDYNLLNSLFVHEDGWMRARSHILVAPRGHRWEWEGLEFVSLGGAPSVDRMWRLAQQRKHGYPLWWADEDITPDDIDRAIAGGRADVMIAHDAPFGVPQIERHISGNPLGFAELDLQYADEGRHKMAQVVDVVRPRFFFHGHYHFRVDDTLSLFNENTGLDDETRIIGLNADGAYGTTAMFDLKTEKFSILD